MANVLLNIEKGIEVAAEDALKFLTGAQTVAAKFGPGVVAALGVLLGAFAKASADVAATVQTPLNIVLDDQTFADIKAVWPDIEAFAKSIGITL